VKIPLGDFNEKLGREKIFKQTIRNESLRQDSNDNGVRIVNVATSKNVIKSTMFLHRNFHKYSWNSPVGKTHHQIDHILIDRRWHSSILDVRSGSKAHFHTDHYLMVAKVGERLAVSKQSTQKFDWKKFNHRKLNELGVRKQYHINTLRTGLLNCLNARSRGLTFSHRASCI